MCYSIRKKFKHFMYLKTQTGLLINITFKSLTNQVQNFEFIAPKSKLTKYLLAT